MGVSAEKEEEENYTGVRDYNIELTRKERESFERKEAQTAVARRRARI